MPRQQAVYGKRSRAVPHKPNDIFASPQNAKQKPVEPIVIVEDKEEDVVEDAQATQKPSSPSRRRRALGERSGNEVLKVELPLARKSKKPSRRKAKDEATKDTSKEMMPVESEGHTPEHGSAEIADEMRHENMPPAAQLEIIAPCAEPVPSSNMSKDAISIERRDSPFDKCVGGEVRQCGTESLPQTDEPAEQVPQLNAFDEHCQPILGLTSHSISTFPILSLIHI